MRPLSLVLVIHSSQILGEEEDVVARAVEAAYRPLLEALWAFPGIKLSLSYSGILPEWLEAHDRPFLERLRGLVARGQVEVLGGAHWGAPLHAIPERDALNQLQRHKAWLTEHGCGAGRVVWLADGAWDGALPRLLARVGAPMTLLDRGLLRGADSHETDGWTVAEREGAAVGVLPVDRDVSGLLPWTSPRIVAQVLQERATQGRKLLVLSLSGEQLGVHPHSARWCWVREHGWIRRFFEMLVAQDFWLRLTLPSAVLNQSRPSGRVAPVSGVPAEVGVAALAAAEGRALSRRLRAAPSLDEPAPPVGPPWESFLVRCDEANRLHKRMLRASLALYLARRKLRDRADAAPPSDPTLAAAWLELSRAQGAGCYHAAPGGGLLRAEVRHAAWSALLRAEKIIRARVGEGALHHEVADHDCDGQREVLVQTPVLSAVVRPAAGGAITELGLWNLGNLLNTLTRREEVWHEDIQAEAALPMLIDEEEEDTEEVTDRATSWPERTSTSASREPEGDEESTTGSLGTGGTAPRGPPLPPLEADLDRLLFVDRHSRAAFQDRFLGAQTTLENLRRGQHPELGDFLDSAWQIIDAEQDEEELLVQVAREGVCMDGDRQHLVRLAKTYRFYRDRPSIDVAWEVTNRLSEPFRARFAVEINLGLDAKVLDRYLEIPDLGVFPLDHVFEEREVHEVHWVLRDHHRRLRMQLAQPAHLYHYPVMVPVRTRLGYSSGFQGTCLVLAWDLSLWGGEKVWQEISLEIEVEP